LLGRYRRRKDTTAGNVIETHEHEGDFKQWRTKSCRNATDDERFLTGGGITFPN
jgi:hypothetical protein